MPHVNALPHLCAIFLTACQAEIGIDSGLVLALYEHKRLNIFLIYLVGWRHCAEQSGGKGVSFFSRVLLFVRKSPLGKHRIYNKQPGQQQLVLLMEAMP